ncbi:hypothetical protein SS50377_23334 [Spironucleus salmonicida]|uniref:Uncharacterized protein n=1 Tax=Spironucleus salmonicida TaxID=348837 RepID=V6LRL8_9EUKA|nr:hypothetical protein SS50377_23334 [Spironucleus salmonicida]|eukprot:EST47205.1 Hypothetical protein SS50377_12715 [Spironucleus salmonicida]
MDNLEDKFIQQKNFRHQQLINQNEQLHSNETHEQISHRPITYYTLLDAFGTACLNVNKFPSKETAEKLKQVINSISKNIEQIPEKELSKDLLLKVEKSIDMIVQGADPEGPLQFFVKMVDEKNRGLVLIAIKQALKGSSKQLEFIQQQLSSDISYKKTAEITDDIIKIITKMKFHVHPGIFEVFSQVKVKNLKNLIPSSKHSFKQTREKLSKKMKKIKENLTDLEAHLVVYNQESRENETDAYQKCFCNSILELCLTVLKNKHSNLLLPSLKILQLYKPVLANILIQDLANLLKNYIRNYIQSFDQNCLEMIVKLTDLTEVQIFDVRARPVFSLRRDIEALKTDTNGVSLGAVDEFYFRACEFVCTTEGIENRICLVFMCLNIFKINTDDRAKLMKKILEKQEENEISFARFCKELISNIPGFRILDEWVKNQYIKLNINQDFESVFD